MNTKTWKELKDEIFGKVGNSRRDELDKDSALFVAKIQKSQKKAEKRPNKEAKFPITKARAYSKNRISEWAQHKNELLPFTSKAGDKSPAFCI